MHYSMKQSAKEPIILAKFRKNQKDKENRKIMYQKPYQQNDISSLESTLNFNKKNQNYENMLQSYHLSNIYNKLDIYPSFANSSSNFQNTSKMIKSTYNPSINLNHTQFLQKKDITQSGTSIHTTTISNKPNAHSISNKENIILHQPKIEKLKTRAISISNVTSCKNSARKSTGRQQISSQISLQNDQLTLRQIKFNFNYQNNPSYPSQKPLLPQKSKKQIQNQAKMQQYSLKIQQFQQREKQYAQNLMKLTTKLQAQQKQKKILIDRINNIQNDLHKLIEQNLELQQLNVQCSSKDVHTQDVQIQVIPQIAPIYVRDSFTQTNVTLGIQHSLPDERNSQQQRMILLLQNQVRQFQAELYHRQMFNAQRINFLESQLYQLRCDYQRCKNLNDRPNINDSTLIPSKP